MAGELRSPAPPRRIPLRLDEIFNECANNQMRDVFIDEIYTDDPEKFVLDKFKGKEVSYEKSVLPDGSIVFDIMTSGIRQRYTFTEI